ncbi:OsmC family protein [Legionella tucsonensis]|uniref:OsmC-like protein n=1 Tax=Legionella tucsonensis TaxID=40335 RepID=A0A0W0ZRF1_9GAMM|nr:OsmC family protein [Legionella tucsonensis]KTD71534.1 OsmC-like protein [Legionella tucsonensis]
MSPQHTTHQEINGINTQALKKTIGEIQKNPELAKCEFRVHNEWINGDENTSEAYKFYAACNEQMHKKTFKFHAGEPELLAGHDKGANPVEFLLSGLSACMTTTIAYYAALNGYKIKNMDSDFKGELDLQGIFNLDPDVRPGYQKIYAKFKIETDAPVEKLKEFYPFSPVYDVVSKSVPIEVIIETC